IARAITSLPVPVSPRSSTALPTGATMAIVSVTSLKAALSPISGPAMPVPPGQTHVGDDARYARERTGDQKHFCGFEGDGFVSGGFEDALHRFSNTTIVVDGRDDHIRPRHLVRTLLHARHRTRLTRARLAIGLFRRSRGDGCRVCRRGGPARPMNGQP